MLASNALLSTTSILIGSSPAAAPPSTNSRSFFKLLITQLKHKDPLSPKDLGETLQQLAAPAQVSLRQGISSLLRRLLGKGSTYDLASWLGRTALVPSSNTLPLTDIGYAGEVLTDRQSELDITFRMIVAP